MSIPSHPSLAVTATSISSTLLRALSVVTLRSPHLVSFPISAILIPITYLSYLLSWIVVDQRTHGRVAEIEEVLELREVTVQMTKGEKKKLRRLNREVNVRREGHHMHHQLPQPTIHTLLSGSSTSSRSRNVLSLVLNTLLALSSFDLSWTSRLAFQEDDLTYARTTSLSSHASTLSFRLPAAPPYASSSIKVAYRPLLAPELLSVSSPTSWSESEPVAITADNDWTGAVTLDDLAPGNLYEYRLIPDQGAEFPSEDSPSTSLNFTTFPDESLAKLTGSHFRFVHASSPVYYPLSYSLDYLPSILPLKTPFVSPSPTHILHSFRTHALRQPAWKTLAVWLEDMRDRTAWAQVVFGIVGRLEEKGKREKPLGGRSIGAREKRQLLASRDVRDVYEALPILPSAVHSLSQGSKLEAGALGTPEASFSYGDVPFFRLRKPFVEHGDENAQDWQVDVDEMSAWLSSVNSTGFKFVLSPITLSPFFGGSQLETDWRTYVLDVLAYVPNVVVLAETHHGFSASILRKTVVEIASPPLDQPPTQSFFSTRPILPDLTKATEATTSKWIKHEGQVVEEVVFEKLDSLIKYIPVTSGAKWTSIEVDSMTNNPNAIVLAFDKGMPVWRLEIVASMKKKRTITNNAVGTLAESFQTMLTKFGLLSKKWF
ncbi:hypothetical protein P7C73_g3560, partial [Tremellales sp. Uapishka_1]